MELINDIDDNFRKALEAEGFEESMVTHLFKKSLGKEKILYLEIHNTLSGKVKKLFFYYYLPLEGDNWLSEINHLQNNADFVNELFPQLKVKIDIIGGNVYYHCGYMTAICDVDELVPEMRVAYAFIQEAAHHIYNIHPSRELHKNPNEEDNDDEEEDNNETVNNSVPF